MDDMKMSWEWGCEDNPLDLYRVISWQEFKGRSFRRTEWFANETDAQERADHHISCSHLPVTVKKYKQEPPMPADPLTPAEAAETISEPARLAIAHFRREEVTYSGDRNAGLDLSREVERLAAEVDRLRERHTLLYKRNEQLILALLDVGDWFAKYGVTNRTQGRLRDRVMDALRNNEAVVALLTKEPT